MVTRSPFALGKTTFLTNFGYFDFMNHSNTLPSYILLALDNVSSVLLPINAFANQLPINFFHVPLLLTTWYLLVVLRGCKAADIVAGMAASVG